MSLLSALLALGSGTTWSAPVEGVIVEVDRERLTLVLKVDEAGADPVRASIGRGDAQILNAGDAVRGDLVSFGDGYRLQTIWPNDPVKRGTIARLGDALRKDTLQRGSKVFRGVGEYMPKFALYDTDGSLFLGESLKGQYVLMNFIFTRCANPQMCPAATARMVELQGMLKDEGITDFHQVSITLDPVYDTPGIFTAYAMDKGIDTSTFHLLGGPVQIVEDMKMQMGVLSEPDEEEIIRHTMSTALIDPPARSSTASRAACGALAPSLSSILRTGKRRNRLARRHRETEARRVSFYRAETPRGQGSKGPAIFLMCSCPILLGHAHLKELGGLASWRLRATKKLTLRASVSLCLRASHVYPSSNPSHHCSLCRGLLFPALAAGGGVCLPALRGLCQRGGRDRGMRVRGDGVLHHVGDPLSDPGGADPAH